MKRLLGSGLIFFATASLLGGQDEKTIKVFRYVDGTACIGTGLDTGS
ncbi:MAG: hypothetical protein WGN25_10540 [Candidatus Electrothrix sp. GW3-4]